MLLRIKRYLSYMAAILLAAIGYEYAREKISQSRVKAIADKLEKQQQALGVQIAVTRQQLEDAAQEYANQKGDESDEAIRSFYLHLIANKR